MVGRYSDAMPVLVVGADTPLGTQVMAALAEREGEIRAFVTDPEEGAGLKSRSVKVAIGDVSDPSHVGSAALNCFSIVLLTEAALDDRERSFAGTPELVLAGWAEAIAESGAERAIWVETAGTEGTAGLLRGLPLEVAVVPANVPGSAGLIVDLDDAAQIPGDYLMADTRPS